MCSIGAKAARHDNLPYLAAQRTPESPEYSDYAGRWIALVRGLVVATGATAHEALLSCRMMRLKDDFVLRFIPQEHAPFDPSP